MADFAEADQRQLLALEVIDVPQEGAKHVRPQVANLPWAARRIFGLYRPRDRRCDFFQRSRDHRRIAKQSQTVFKCPGINSFSRLQRCWLDFPAAPVNSVEAEDTARTFSRHCGYNRKQAGSLRHLCGYFRRIAANRPSCCRFEVLCSFAERASTGGSSQARGTTSSMLRPRPRAPGVAEDETCATSPRTCPWFCVLQLLRRSAANGFHDQTFLECGRG